MAFRYVAYNADRDVIKGRLDVSRERDAKEALREAGYSLLSLRQARTEISIPQLLPTFFGVKPSDVITFSRMLATLVNRGVNTLAALELLREQFAKAAFRDVINEVVQDVRRGFTLSNALSRHPEVFSPIYCRTIKVSEQTGNVEIALSQMANYMEKDRLLKSKIARSLAYPAFVLVVGIGVVALLMTVTLPSLSTLFLDLGEDLPLPTRILVGVTGFLNSYILFMLALLVMAAALVIWAVRKPNVQWKLHEAALQMPLIGHVVTLREVIQFSRTLSTCMVSSIPMSEALRLAVETTGNQVVAKTIRDARENILQGHTLAQTLRKSDIFPQPLIQVIRVGEESGTLSEDLNTIAEMYEFQLDRRISTVISVFGPAIMLLLGDFVAFIAVSMITPIYTALGQIE